MFMSAMLHHSKNDQTPVFFMKQHSASGKKVDIRIKPG